MKQQGYIETERTLLRKLSIDDSEDFYNLNLDSEVIRYTGDTPFQDIEETKLFLANYDQYDKFGVGRLAVIDKRTNDFLGWCGLKYSPSTNEYDIGFRFFRNYWNMGLATEAAQKCIEYGFVVLNIESIVGRAQKENRASIQVLKKLGMTFKETYDFDGFEGVVYQLLNPYN